jgi:hypothetical protein
MPGIRRRWSSALALIASSFAGQACILAVVIALLLVTVHMFLSPPSRPGSPAAVPGYYAALTSRADPGPPVRGGIPSVPHDITIRATRSGAVLATVSPPPGFATFSLVTGGTGDGEFLVAAQGWKLVPGWETTRPVGEAPTGTVDAAPVRLYALRFSPASRATALTPLSVPDMPGTQFWSAALSPDGSRVAVAVTPGGVDQDAAPQQVRVYALPGGAERMWSFAKVPNAYPSFTGSRLDPLALSWSADDRTLAVSWGNPNAVRLLDTQEPAGSLPAASRAVTTSSKAFRCDGSHPALTSGGSVLICAGTVNWTGRPVPARAGFGKFSVATGKLVTTVSLARPRGCCQYNSPIANLIWASPAGSAYVQTYSTSMEPTAMTVIGDGKPYDIPLSPQVAAVAW